MSEIHEGEAAIVNLMTQEVPIFVLLVKSTQQRDNPQWLNKKSFNHIRSNFKPRFEKSHSLAHVQIDHFRKV